jgi:ABC-type Na+ efflux pump permease subunit
MDNIKTIVNNVTDVFVSLLALAIVASLLVGPSNMAFLGDVAGNIRSALATLGGAGLPGLIALGIILMLFRQD